MPASSDRSSRRWALPAAWTTPLATVALAALLLAGLVVAGAAAGPDGESTPDATVSGEANVVAEPAGPTQAATGAAATNGTDSRAATAVEPTARPG